MATKTDVITRFKTYDAITRDMTYNAITRVLHEHMCKQEGRNVAGP